MATTSRYARFDTTKNNALRIVLAPLTGNPKRGASAARFAAYRDGMTVGKALAAGVRPDDIRWDLAHGFINIPA